MDTKKTIIWGGLIILGLVVATGLGWLENPVNPRTVSVTGECLTNVPKDKTAITLRVTTLDPSAAVSMKMATSQAAQITEFLKGKSVEMQTTQFNSYEKTQWNHETQTSQTIGIETTVAIEISADNIETIEEVLNEFAGEKNIYSENLRMYSSPAILIPAMEKCLTAAVENARVRADALAAGDGRRAGKILNVSYGAPTDDENYGPTPRVAQRFGAKMAMADAAVNTAGTIVAKDTQVSVVVSATFEIK